MGLNGLGLMGIKIMHSPLFSAFTPSFDIFSHQKAIVAIVICYKFSWKLKFIDIMTWIKALTFKVNLMRGNTHFLIFTEIPQGHR